MVGRPRWLRSAGRRDDNEPGIVDGLKRLGASVDKLPGGGGRPDLLVGFQGTNYLIRVAGIEKCKRFRTSGGLSESEMDFNARWRGRKIPSVTSLGEALEVIT